LTLKVFAEAAKKNPALVLVIAGWPSINGYYDYVRYLREDTYAAAASRIIFLQSCTDGQLLYLYRRAAVFFSACSHEGSSGSIMDALVFNLPVIVRRTSSIQEILGFSGIYFDAAALPEQIAAAVLSIAENPAERAKALEIQKKYAPASPFNQNPHPVQKLLKALYETAAGGPSR
jgi:glycosyltransferase involved in cell wall biosynthesis